MSNDPELFRVSVKAVIRHDDGVVILRKFDGKWDLPGGRLEPDEDISNSLIREIQEEMGVLATVGQLIYTGVRRREPPKQNVVVVAHLCTIDASLEDIVLSDEHDMVRVIQADEMSELVIADSYREALEHAFAVMAEH